MSRNLRNGHDRSHQSSKISVSRLVFVIFHDHGDLKRSFHLIEQEINEIYDCAVSERNPLIFKDSLKSSLENLGELFQ